MAQPFSVRAALCTGAVMVFFGALATGDLPIRLVQFSGADRPGSPSVPLGKVEGRMAPGAAGERRPDVVQPPEDGAASSPISAADYEAIVRAVLADLAQGTGADEACVNPQVARRLERPDRARTSAPAAEWWRIPNSGTPLPAAERDEIDVALAAALREPQPVQINSLPQAWIPDPFRLKEAGIRCGEVIGLSSPRIRGDFGVVLFNSQIAGGDEGHFIVLRRDGRAWRLIAFRILWTDNAE